MELLRAAVVLVISGTAIPANAEIGADLEKECWQLALKAHPASLPDIPATTTYGVVTIDCASPGKKKWILY